MLHTYLNAPTEITFKSLQSVNVAEQRAMQLCSLFKTFNSFPPYVLCCVRTVGPSPELVRQREAKWINIISNWDRILLKKTSKVCQFLFAFRQVSK